MYSPGDFSFISSVNERAMLTKAYQAKSQDILKKDSNRTMERIALIGWELYVLEYLGAL